MSILRQSRLVRLTIILAAVGALVLPVAVKPDHVVKFPAVLAEYRRQRLLNPARIYQYAKEMFGNAILGAYVRQMAFRQEVVIKHLIVPLPKLPRHLHLNLAKHRLNQIAIPKGV